MIEEDGVISGQGIDELVGQLLVAVIVIVALELERELISGEGIFTAEGGDRFLVNIPVMRLEEFDGLAWVFGVGEFDVSALGVVAHPLFGEVVEVLPQPGGMEFSEPPRYFPEARPVFLSWVSGEDFREGFFGLVAGAGPPGVSRKFGAFGGGDGRFGIDAGPVDKDEIVEVVGVILAGSVAGPEFLHLARAGIEQPEGEAIVKMGRRDVGERGDGVAGLDAGGNAVICNLAPSAQGNGVGILLGRISRAELLSKRPCQVAERGHREGGDDKKFHRLSVIIT